MTAFCIWLALLPTPATPHAPAFATSGHIGTAIPVTRVSMGPRPAGPRGLAQLQILDLCGNPSVARVQPPQQQAAEPPIGQQFEMVYLTPKQPYRFRVSLRLRAQSLSTTWTAGLRSMFDTFDRDNDGRLNGHELQFIFPVSGIVQLMTTGVFYPQGDDPPQMPEIDRDGDTRVSFAEFVSFFGVVANDTIQGTPFSRDTSFDPLSLNLFQKLDRDHDGQLSADELDRVKELPALFDQNHDDCVSRKEFETRFESTSKAVPENDTENRRPNDVVWKRGQLDANDLATIFNYYDQDTDGTLTNNELPLIDDGNRQISQSEFKDWYTKLPPINIIMRWTDYNEQCEVDVLGADHEPYIESGRTHILLSDAMVDAVCHGRLTIDRKEESVIPYADAFPDNTQSLTDDTIGGQGESQILYVIAYLSDLNDDGKLSRHEFDSFISIQKELTVAALQFQLVEKPLNLFSFLDYDDDSRLSPRELQNAKRRLLSYQPGHQQNFQELTVRQPILILTLEPLGGGTNPSVGRRVRPSKTPIWFQKMDRNDDGDVAPSEFLGTQDQFSRLDADGDRLIDVHEAMQISK